MALATGDHVCMPTNPTIYGRTEDDDAGQWIIWRQDDNGNRFEVARRDSRAEAEELAATMEARGHKQTYWVAAAASLDHSRLTSLLWPCRHSSLVFDVVRSVTW